MGTTAFELYEIQPLGLLTAASCPPPVADCTVHPAEWLLAETKITVPVAAPEVHDAFTIPFVESIRTGS
jgi:hypothetical protein